MKCVQQVIRHEYAAHAPIYEPCGRWPGDVIHAPKAYRYGEASIGAHIPHEYTAPRVATIVPNTTGERADVWLFESVCVASFRDFEQAAKIVALINTEAEEWFKVKR